MLAGLTRSVIPDSPGWNQQLASDSEAAVSGLLPWCMPMLVHANRLATGRRSAPMKLHVFHVRGGTGHYQSFHCACALTVVACAVDRSERTAAASPTSGSCRR